MNTLPIDIVLSISSMFDDTLDRIVYLTYIYNDYNVHGKKMIDNELENIRKQKNHSNHLKHSFDTVTYVMKKSGSSYTSDKVYFASCFSDFFYTYCDNISLERLSGYIPIETFETFNIFLFIKLKELKQFRLIEDLRHTFPSWNSLLTEIMTNY